MQDILRGRRRRGFLGREAERAAFTENFAVSPEDERHRFLFHIHGAAGVGKTFLLAELEHIAQEQGALTARVDESTASVPELLGALSAQFARQDHRFRELERLLADWRERQHEAASVDLDELLDSNVPEPSPGSMVAARASLIGLGLVPGAGVFAGAVDAAQLARGADRLRAGLGMRLRSPEDVQMVMSPERVLTPVFLRELADAAGSVPWIVLFFDAYERTAPFLDSWLRDVMTTTRYGTLVSRVVVVTAGQYPLHAARWGEFADALTDWPLGNFTEAQTRGLLRNKGVVCEPVVREVLRLSGGLPVLVSTLAAGRPTEPGHLNDPSTTAVEGFLKWERDPVRRAAALAGALPLHLDVDIFRAAVGCSHDEADALFPWLHSLPFVAQHGTGVRYHDVVRAQMLRLQRRRSLRDWNERHTALSTLFSQWREQAEEHLDPGMFWKEERWQGLRLAESYHLLCTGSRRAWEMVLLEVASACTAGEAVARRWAQVFRDAGRDTEYEELREWGRHLQATLAEGGTVQALHLLLGRADFGPEEQATILVACGGLRRLEGEARVALADFNRAVALSPRMEPAYVGRALAHAELGEYSAAIDDLDHADALAPDTPQTLRRRGDYYRITGQLQESMHDLQRAVELAPLDPMVWTSRGSTHDALGNTTAAITDLNHALELQPHSVRALIHRARVRIFQPRHTAQALQDLDRAVELEPATAWVRCERGAILRIVGRHASALADFDRAIELDPGYGRAYSGRGATLGNMGRYPEALSDLNRAVELLPLDGWPLSRRCWVQIKLGAHECALADANHALALAPGDVSTLMHRAEALHGLGRFSEARADLEDTIEKGFGRANTWSPWRRIEFCFATGRLQQARSDLEFLLEHAGRKSAARAHHLLARIHLLSDQTEQAKAALHTSWTADPQEHTVLETLCTAHRRTGQGITARQTAEQLFLSDEVSGLTCLALTLETCSGRRAAHTWWHAAEQALHQARLPAGTRHRYNTLICTALDRWPAVDADLTRLLATPPVRWIELAELAATLGELLHAPGIDHTRLAPRLTALRAARDFLHAHYEQEPCPRPAVAGHGVESARRFADIASLTSGSQEVGSSDG
ncbi:tetratricopeptide repeat protein [Streptomyces sp. NPDC057298]|uniref:tetratricopeptide repeat protein n=1 Tax=Streptomyces sp. NPDC057298 TaxID=3346091 RepID=UPI00363D2B2C